MRNKKVSLGGSNKKKRVKCDFLALEPFTEKNTEIVHFKIF